MAFHVPNKYRIRGDALGSTDAAGNNGAFIFGRGGAVIRCLASDGGGWEHVSVSPKAKRTPTWEEMCFVKGLFWDPEDVVMQLHPRASHYVNCHPYCLHLWRPMDAVIPEPPSIMVGPKP